jgi:hypothetical protein
MSVDSWIGLLEGFPSAGQGPIQGEHIPSLDQIKKRLEESLVLSNVQYPREGAVQAVAMLIRSTAMKYGKEAAAAVLDELFHNTPVLLLHKGEEVNGNYKDGSNPTSHNDDCGGGEHVLEGYRDPARATGNRVSVSKGYDGADKEGNISRPEEGAQIFALPTRKSRDGISRRQVELELEEHEKDLSAFSSAYSLIHQRVVEVKDEGRLMTLVNWSGTSAVMGSLELATHAMERTIEELRDILKRMDAGAIVNSDEE